MERDEVYSLIEQHYRENYDDLLAAVNRRLHDEHDAEDTVQEVYARACQYWDTLQNPKLIDHWLRVILANCERDVRKDRKMRGQTSEYEQAKDMRAVDPAAFSQIELTRIQDMIGEKSPNIQTILSLYFFRGYDPLDIENVVPEKLLNIKQIIQRFKKELRGS